MFLQGESCLNHSQNPLRATEVAQRLAQQQRVQNKDPMLSNPISGQYLELRPQSTSGTTATSATLVVSTQSFSNVQFGAGYSTLQQLRTGVEANPLE